MSPMLPEASALRRLREETLSVSERSEYAQQLAVKLLGQTAGLLAKVKRALIANDAEAARGVVEAIKFLCLVASDRNRQWTPSHRVDLVWHEMILFTRAYAEFCRVELGEFIHHQPSDDHEKNQRAFASTLEAYQRWFGEADEAFWGKRNHALAACGPCDTGSD